MIACDYRYPTTLRNRKLYIMFTRLPTGRLRTITTRQRKPHSYLSEIEYACD